MTSPPDPHTTLELDVAACKSLLESENPPILIDCREPHEFEFCRIEGAPLVPLSDFAGRAEALFSSRETMAIIYCHAGIRSQHAALYLRNQGYRNVFSMIGGIDAWSLQIDPSVPRY